MKTTCTAAGLAAALLLAAAQASAGGPAPAAPAPAPAPIADNELAGLSGGQATTTPILPSLVSSTQTATNGNNTVTAGGDIQSGDVTLGQDAFQGFAGIGNFVVNTGHNNNLLGSLNVSINMLPAGTQ